MKSRHLKKRSFARPLIIMSMSLLTLAFVLQTVYIVGIIRRELKSIQEDHYAIITKSFADMLELEVRGNEHQLEGFSEALSIMENASRLDYEKLLNRVQNSNRYFETVFFTDPSGKVIYSPDKGFAGTDLSAREYFIALSVGGRKTFTTAHALRSEATGNITIVHGARVTRNGELAGILGASLNLTLFGEELLVKKKIGETGQVMVMDGDGLFLIHPDEDIRFSQASELNPLFGEIIAGEEYEQYRDYTLGGTGKQGFFIRMAGLEWVIGLSVDRGEAFFLADSVLMRFIVSNAAMILITSCFIFFYIRKNLVAKVRSLEYLMARASEGILTDQGRVSGRDEIAEMAGNLNTLLDSLRRFFSTLNSSIGALEGVGTDLSANMEETASAVNQIRVNVESSLVRIDQQGQSVLTTASAAEQMARNISSLEGNVERQNESIEQGSSAVEEMISRIREVSASTESSERLMTTLSASSVKGQEKIRGVSLQAQTIAGQSQELTEANNLISGIAARTNLLAMNAAIEAAHAGDAGRGFAVVADEIRNLAEQSTKQSAQVRNTIKSIGGSIGEIVAGSRESLEAFDEIRVHVENMESITREIRNAMEEQVSGSSQVMDSLHRLRAASSEVKAGSNEMGAGNGNILRAIGDLARISEEVSMAIREINNGMEEINGAVVSVAGLTVTNRDSIEEVKREASRFVTNNEGDRL